MSVFHNILADFEKYLLLPHHLLLQWLFCTSGFIVKRTLILVFSSYYSLQTQQHCIRFKTIYEIIFNEQSVFLLEIISSVGLIKIVFLVARRKFRFGYAIGCIELVSEKKDEVEKVEYLMKGLNSYI